MTAELWLIAGLITWCAYLHWTLRELRVVLGGHYELIGDHEKALQGIKNVFLGE